ncbi:carboxymuconolactone decarboxylase [Mycobacteroides abscessus subsp. abscessus]|nr:carboxymuconolactone decarboxylase [Mycobacteroides abscessus subsp. abscessus]
MEPEFADAVTNWRTTEAFDERTRLAAEYADRYATDHHGIDEEFWARMAAHYSQAEIVELSMCGLRAARPFLTGPHFDSRSQSTRSRVDQSSPAHSQMSRATSAGSDRVVAK